MLSKTTIARIDIIFAATTLPPQRPPFFFAQITSALSFSPYSLSLSLFQLNTSIIQHETNTSMCALCERVSTLGCVNVCASLP